MSLWIEFRCSHSGKPTADGKTWDSSRCWSHDNEGPMGMAGDSITEVKIALRSLAEDAVKSGWRRTKDGWICPHCAKARGEQEPPLSTPPA